VESEEWEAKKLLLGSFLAPAAVAEKSFESRLRHPMRGIEFGGSAQDRDTT
jgi:hypothetical protein